MLWGTCHAFLKITFFENVDPMCLQVRDSGSQLPPAGHIFEKRFPLIDFDNFSDDVAPQVWDSGSQLPPAGHIFEKWRPLENIEGFSKLLFALSNRVLAGVLPPAGQIFEK